MLRQSLATFLVGAAMLAPVSDASAAEVPSRQLPVAATSTSTGHNLRDRREAVTADKKEPVKALPATSMLAPRKAKKGISVNGPAAKLPAKARMQSSAAFYESFEDCTLLSHLMPEGWTLESRGEVPTEEADHWIGFSKQYANYYMFAPPIDGQMMVGVLYNDDVYKDEWLISPEITVTSGDYDLSFYWYTTPFYMYVVDRYHVDFEEGVFIDREIQFNVEVLARVVGEEEWTVIYDLEHNMFSDMEYAEIASTDYYEMQKSSASLSQFAGKTIQIAFRYFGQEGQTFTLDGVSVDFPTAEVSYMPHYSRLFYGYTADERMWYMPASIEFYPVNHPVSWYNDSRDTDGIEFSWSYQNLDADGNLVTMTGDDPETLSVTYRPDYADEAFLMNNYYAMPEIIGTTRLGGKSSYKSSADFLQAGGTPEFDFGDEENGYCQYMALDFDILTEGLGVHTEEDEELGLFAVPIFGHNVNTDDWWRHHSFPETYEEGKYSYVDGFANMYLPHPSAPLVVRAVSAVAVGTISPEAEFTLRIYTMTEDGYIVEQPIAESKIRGNQVIAQPNGMTRDYLLLNFKLDEPVVFSTEGTGYGYMVEISGYRSDAVEYFAPMQSLVPNRYEWALSFYHCYASFNYDLTDEMSYVCLFKNDAGDDLCTAFAIGLDAHYPWLALDGEPEAADNVTKAYLQSYYNAFEYTVTAPEWLDVKLKGRYNLELTATPTVEVADDCVVPVTLTAPGVSLSIDLPIKASSGIAGVGADGDGRADVYNAQGILVKRAATPAELRSLPAGMYIHGNNKIFVK